MPPIKIENKKLGSLELVFFFSSFLFSFFKGPGRPVYDAGYLSVLGSSAKITERLGSALFAAVVYKITFRLKPESCTPALGGGLEKERKMYNRNKLYVLI